MIVVFGNTKGGTGKSTLAVHATLSLILKGYRLVAIDADGDQGTMSRYWENRKIFAQRARKNIAMPVRTLRLSNRQELSSVEQEMAKLAQQKDWDLIVIDTPGHDSPLSRYAHSLADVLVTTMNDSTIDLDLLINVQEPMISDKLTFNHYANLVWDQRLQKAKQGLAPMQWLMVRNRLHALSSRNQLFMKEALSDLSKRIGFHLAAGIAERVIYRELFPYGLTVLDQKHLPADLPTSHLAAQQEIDGLTKHILNLCKLGQSPHKKP